MPKNTRPNPCVRKGLPMSSLDWELLAVLDRENPAEASRIISLLAYQKCRAHFGWVSERRLWEKTNQIRSTMVIRAGEPFVGERYE